VGNFSHTRCYTAGVYFYDADDRVSEYGSRRKSLVFY